MSGGDEEPEGEADALRADPTRRRRLHRTTGQRIVIVGTALAAIIAFASAAALAGAQYVVGRRTIVDIEDPSGRIQPGGGTTTTTRTPSGPPGTIEPVIDDDPPATSRDTSPDRTTTVPPTFPVADAEAKNFLITGADNNSCIDPNSPIGRSIGDREGDAGRSDTIVIWRVDPATSRAAVLSFPRDLWVTIPNAGTSRINSAYRRDDPQLLIDTIYANFGIGVDHFVQVDFCAFKVIVDAVGGVSVPFLFPVRDTDSGLNVTEPGCFEFDGETALGYVRSRHFEYLPPGADPATGWEDDVSSDLGRVSRQQDFQRRILEKVARKGALNPSVARALIEATTDYVVTDSGLSPSKLLEFAGVLRKVQPEGIPNYQITAEPATISGNAVLLPQIDNERMQEVLSLFRGQISLQRLPETKATTTTSTTTTTTTTIASATTSFVGTGDGGSGWAPATPGTTPGTSTPSPDPSTPEDIEFGIVPPAGVTCD